MTHARATPLVLVFVDRLHWLAILGGSRTGVNTNRSRRTQGKQRGRSLSDVPLPVPCIDS